MESAENSSGRATSDDPSLPLVVAVVLNWRAPSATRRCLRALAEVQYERLQIVVIDNGCKDFEDETWPESVVYLQSATNLGYAGGANLGIEHALACEAEYVWFVNNDSQPDPASLAAMIEVATADAKIAAIGPKILRTTEPDTIDSVALDYDRRSGRFYLLGHDELDRGQFDHLSQVDAISGCAPMVRSDFLRTTGGFDDRYFLYLEDLDLCLRLTRANGTIACAPAARVLHDRPGASDGRQSDASLYYTSRNHLLLLATHGDGGSAKRRARQAFAIVLSLAFALRGPLRHAPARLRAVLAGIADYYRGRYGPRPGS